MGGCGVEPHVLLRGGLVVRVVVELGFQPGAVPTEILADELRRPPNPPSPGARSVELGIHDAIDARVAERIHDLGSVECGSRDLVVAPIGLGTLRARGLAGAAVAAKPIAHAVRQRVADDAVNHVRVAAHRGEGAPVKPLRSMEQPSRWTAASISAGEGGEAAKAEDRDCVAGVDIASILNVLGAGPNPRIGHSFMLNGPAVVASPRASAEARTASARAEPAREAHRTTGAAARAIPLSRGWQTAPKAMLARRRKVEPHYAPAWRLRDEARLIGGTGRALRMSTERLGSAPEGAPSSLLLSLEAPGSVRTLIALDREPGPDERRGARVDEARHLFGRHPHAEADRAAVARSLGLGGQRFCIRFREATGLAPGQNRIPRRVAAARRWLACGGVHVKEVAARLGYANPDAFSALFRQMPGNPPSHCAPASSAQSSIERP